MQTCIACGMPLESPAVVGAELEKGPACVHCVTSEGTLKSCEEIFNGGVEFFLSSAGLTDRALAERVTRKNMKLQPAWQEGTFACLDGVEATDEEFEAVMAKL